MKKGFTLSEVLVTIAILGIIAVLIVPQLVAKKPNKAKLLFKKSYQLTSQVVSGILSDDNIYKPDANGDTLFSKGDSDTYFCQKFAAQLNTVGDVTCNNSTTSLAFVTPDGMKWSINGALNKFSDEGAEVIINVNPDASQVGATGTQGVDYFVIKIKDNGQIYVDGNKEQEYLTECEGSNCDEPSTPGVTPSCPEGQIPNGSTCCDDSDSDGSCDVPTPEDDCSGSGMALIDGNCCEDFNDNGECDYNENGSGSGSGIDCSGSGMALIGSECCEDLNGNDECDYDEEDSDGDINTGVPCSTHSDCGVADQFGVYKAQCLSDGFCHIVNCEDRDNNGVCDHGEATCEEDCGTHPDCVTLVPSCSDYTGFTSGSGTGSGSSCSDVNNNGICDDQELGTYLTCGDYDCAFANCGILRIECGATTEEACTANCRAVDNCWMYVSSCPNPEEEACAGSGMAYLDGECCEDINDNSICDRDEEYDSPTGSGCSNLGLSLIDGNCCYDSNSNDICDDDETGSGSGY